MRKPTVLLVMLAAALVAAQTASKIAGLKTETLSRARQLAIACLMYASDYDQALPLARSSAAFQAATYPYHKNRNLQATMNPAGGELAFNAALRGASLTALRNPAETVLIHDTKPWVDGARIAAFADGHAKILSAAEWAKVAASLKATYAKPKRRGGR
ncbi:MAG: hypothetical protein KIS66_02370 [Fimbriimonadaceae bacterium]|nr:hypothetical protein [Fimbriimonadaceae bacterium]